MSPAIALNTTPSFSLSRKQIYRISNGLSVNEGSSINFTISTPDLFSGTLYWTLSGSVNNSDFSSPANAVSSGGSVSISAWTGNISFTIASDATTEGQETFTLLLRTGSTSGPIVAGSSIVSINDTSQGAVTCCGVPYDSISCMCIGCSIIC